MIPATQRRIFIQLNASADVDLKLETYDGILLLDYDTSMNWGDTLTDFEYDGMTFKFCVDGCAANITIGPYADGSTYDVTGGPSYRNEFLYVENANTDLVV